MSKYLLLAAGLLAGTVIGAGIFSLPFVFSQLGLGLGVLYLVFFALVYFIVHSMYAALVSTSREEHHFFYLAKKYLPAGGGLVASLIILGELLFTLVVYLVLAPTFAAMVFGGGGTVAALVFWILGSIFIFVRASRQGWTEVAGIVAILVIVGVVLWVSGLNKLVVPLVGSLSVTSLALPFGPLLFAFAGRPAVPAVVKMWRKAKEAKKQFSLSLALLLGTFLPALTYLLFVVAVLTINPHVSPEALNGLFVSPVLRVVLGALGLLTIWTSYFMIGDNLKDILRFDFKLSRLWAGLIPVTLPFLLYLVGFKDFLTVISLTGGIFLALEGVFVVMMWRGAFRGHRWRWLTGLLYAVFVVALGYAVLGVVA